VVENHGLSLTVLLIGRFVLGLGESLGMTGALSWGIATIGGHRSGAVMVGGGIAMVCAFGLGAPSGALLSATHRFCAARVAAALAPGPAFVATLFLKPTHVVAGERTPFFRVVGLIWPSGVGLAMSVIGFGAISAFVTLLFAARGWHNAAFAMTAFAFAFIVARL